MDARDPRSPLADLTAAIDALFTAGAFGEVRSPGGRNQFTPADGSWRTESIAGTGAPSAGPYDPSWSDTIARINHAPAQPLADPTPDPWQTRVIPEGHPYETGQGPWRVGAPRDDDMGDDQSDDGIWALVGRCLEVATPVALGVSAWCVMRAAGTRDFAKWVWRCPYCWMTVSLAGMIVAFSAWEWVLPHS